MKRSLFACLLGVLLSLVACFSQAVAEEPEQDKLPSLLEEAEGLSPYVQIIPILDKKFRYVVNRTLQNKPIRFPLEIKLSGKDSVPFPDWESNEIVNKGDLQGMEIVFEIPADQDTDQRTAETFKVQVTHQLTVFPSGEFATDYAVQHPHLVGRGGQMVKLEVSQDEQRRVFLRGKKGSSLLAVVPQASEKGSALMLCPRHIDLESAKEGERVAVNSTLKIKGLRFLTESKIYRMVQARLKTGLGKGEALAFLQTTENLPPSKRFKDVAKGDFPFVSVKYLPGKDSEIQEYPDLDQGVTTGIRQEFVISNSLQQLGRVWKEFVITVKKIEIGENLKFLYKGVTLEAAPGPCLVLIKEIRLGERFRRVGSSANLMGEVNQLLENAASRKKSLQAEGQENN